jgi:putative DNA primase/helicase
VDAVGRVNITALLRIPAELRERPQWVVWREELPEGRDDSTKVPYQPLSPERRASSTAPESWATFEQAQRALERGEADGAGFVFAEDDPFAGVDLDHCRDPDMDQLDASATAIVLDLDSYTEVSPSGEGVHLIVRGQLPGVGRHRGSVEMYDRARFFSMTGAHVAGTPTTVEAREAALVALYGRLSPVEPAKHVKLPAPLLLADEEFLDRARSARNGSDFERLYSGDVSGYPSRSEADLSLVSRLAFWTRCDLAAIDRLFRSSRLYRAKWERADYREATIAKALEGQTEFYRPPALLAAAQRARRAW